MAVTLKIHGRPTSTVVAREAVRGGPATDGGAAPAVDTVLLNAVEVIGAFDTTPTARAEGAQTESASAKDDDILEFVLESGVSVWTSVAAYRAQQRRKTPSARAATRAQDTTLEIVPDLDAQLVNRGVVSDVAANAIRLLRLKKDDIWEEAKDPKNWPAWLKQQGATSFDQLAPRLVAHLIVWRIESKLRPEEGLYRWERTSAGGDASLLPAGTIPAEKPLLVFIHGTASNTAGSFGALHGEDAGAEWDQLVETFGDRIFAFEHRTMSRSPIDNAIVLANALPNGAQLSLVSHSRGGQVADLLCLANLPKTVCDRYRRRDADYADADAYDRQQLEVLRGLLTKKAFRIQRLIRVASPSQGTLLASENLDRFLSVVTSLIGLIPVVGQSPVYQVIKRITLETAKQRWNPEQIPGLEAMIPSSPLVALLNDPDTKAAGELGVIAGDIEGSNWFKRLGIFLSDTFIYESSDNDLVVNTDSMFRGMARSSESPSRYLFDKGTDVSHFHYFKNQRTRRLLSQALTRPASEWPAEFRALEEARVEPVPMLRSMQTRGGADQPVVFVLPGFTGTILKVQDDTVWLNYLRLARGDFERLAVGTTKVTPTGLVGSYYRDLCEHLAHSHEVIPFGYDWRQSITQAAAQLAAEVTKVTTHTRQPIRFIAHSMGGLVVRRLIKDFPALWSEVAARQGARVVMLGTPNRGSFDMVASFAGVAKTMRQLALLDLSHSVKELVGVVAGFAGAVELLPQSEDWAHFTDKQWKAIASASESGVAPNDGTLAAAKKALADLPTEIPKAECIRYVAGQSPRTLSGLRVEGERLIFEATPAGDGRVTYESGRLPGVPMWYADAEHGDLSSHREAFEAYAQLLSRGETTLLPMQPPVSRALVRSFDHEPEPVLYPTPDAFEAGLLGRRTKGRAASSEAGGRPLQVSVRHGDVQHTQYPVMVGHYEGDTIAGVERIVNGMLKGALEDRYRVGRYPGRVGTVAITLGQQNQMHESLGIHHGAIVVGLGRWGDLTPTRLMQVVQQAAVEYALHVAQCQQAMQDMAAPDLTIHSLLVGSNTSSNIAVEDSVNAIVRGICLANQLIRLQPKDSTPVPSIGRVEFVELYLDTAVDAVKAARRLQRQMEQEGTYRLQVDQYVRKGRGARTRYVSAGNGSYWRRWTISAVPMPSASGGCALPAPLLEKLRAALHQESTQDPQITQALLALAFPAQDGNQGAQPHQLRFLALSDRARAEATVQATQPELVGKLLSQATGKSVYAKDLSKTLFELLVPVDLKEHLLNQDRIVLIVDDTTANYPWELMTDNDRPLCIRMGMIRQLELDDYDAHVRDTTSTAAYVLGNPATPPQFPPLEGARQEAEAVAAQLQQRFEVTHTPNQAGAVTVLNDLFARPYRLVHIAGHGYYNEGAIGTIGARAGVVLDGGIFLTAAEIAKLDPIPELVFLNCCYLGQIDRVGGRRAMPAYHKLAASLSRELIRRGVRAVVAAGWPVADAPASLFAQVFYHHLLMGCCFGSAVLLAREATYSKYPESNTWGAYQAYGDPDFRLQVHNPTRDGEADRPAAPEELLNALELLRGMPESGPDDTQFDVRVQRLKEGVPEAWFEEADVQECLGSLYADRGRFDEATDCYRKAIENDDADGTPTLRAVEQWMNLSTRAVQKDSNRTRTRIEEAIQCGEQLLAIGATAERFSLMGSAYKRLAAIESDTRPRRQHLEKARGYYQKAADRQSQRANPNPDPYPTLSVWMLDTLLGKAPENLPNLVAKWSATARRRFATDHSAWSLIAVADCEMIAAYADGSLPKRVRALSDAYKQAFEESGASVKAQRSACGQLEFLTQMINKRGLFKGSKEDRYALSKALKEIVEAIKPEDAAKPADKKTADTTSDQASTKAPRKSNAPKLRRRSSARSTPAAPSRAGRGQPKQR